jgi:hypothetical protein
VTLIVLALILCPVEPPDLPPEWHPELFRALVTLNERLELAAKNSPKARSISLWKSWVFC